MNLLSMLINRTPANYFRVIAVFVLLLLLLGVRPLFAQQVLVYDVWKGKKVIGNLIASKVVRSNITEFAMESNVTVDMILSFRIYSKVTGIFRDGILIDGKILRKVNDSEKANAHIFWSSDKYYIQADNKTVEFKQKIGYSTACLMHWEPVGFNQVYSENYKKMIPVQLVKPHQYMLTLPDGNKNYYTYQDGICVEAEVNTSMSTAYFKLKSK